MRIQSIVGLKFRAKVASGEANVAGLREAKLSLCKTTNGAKQTSFVAEGLPSKLSFQFYEMTTHTPFEEAKLGRRLPKKANWLSLEKPSSLRVFKNFQRVSFSSSIFHLFEIVFMIYGIQTMHMQEG